MPVEEAGEFLRVVPKATLYGHLLLPRLIGDGQKGSGFAPYISMTMTPMVSHRPPAEAEKTLTAA